RTLRGARRRDRDPGRRMAAFPVRDPGISYRRAGPRVVGVAGVRSGQGAPAELRGYRYGSGRGYVRLTLARIPPQGFFSRTRGGAMAEPKFADLIATLNSTLHNVEARLVEDGEPVEGL